MNKLEKPVSLRINLETRAHLDYLIKCTGLKQADVIRLAVRRFQEQEAQERASRFRVGPMKERSAAAVAKPERKTR